MSSILLAIPAFGDEQANVLINKDFAVSDRAFDGEITLIQFAGGIKFQCPAFESWLNRNKDFGARVALNDSRVPQFLKGDINLNGIEVPGQFSEKVFGTDDEPFPRITRQEDTELQTHAPRLSNISVEGSEINDSNALRISDLAYCVLHEVHGLPPISYRDSTALRNRRIQQLLALLGGEKGSRK